MELNSSPRELGVFASLAFIVGTVVGTGIYLKPALVVGLLAGPWQVLGLWFLGGAFATAGALVYSRLAQNWPDNGGPYLYLSSVYGPWAGSLLLAADVFLARPAAVGALATGLGLVWSLSPVQTLTLAGLSIVALSLWQLRGVRAQGTSQIILTLLQFLPLLGVILAFVVTKPEAGTGVFENSGAVKWSTAFLAILWAYDGWYNITILAGEVNLSHKAFTRVLVGAMSFVTLLYGILNAVLLWRLSPASISGNPVPFLLLFRSWDLDWLQVGLQISLTLAILSTLQGTLACGSRMIVAGGQAGLIQAKVGQSPTGLRPTLAFALWCLGLLATVGGLPQTFSLFDQFSEFTAVIVTLLSSLTVTCLFHSQKFSHPVPFGLILSALFYLLISMVLMSLLVIETRWLAVGGALTVLVLGTFLWARRGGPP